MSIVIPTRNAERTLGEQLGAIAEQDIAVAWEVIVVDNASTDATAGITSRWADRLPNLRVVRCERVGSNAARNTGVRAARAQQILMCDSDDHVLPSWGRQLAAALEIWPLVGGVTRVDALNGEETIRTRPNPVDGEPCTLWFSDLPYAIGANLGFRREVFDAVDGFDEAFAYGATEVDFCWRAQYAGFELGFAPDAVVQYRFRARTRDAMRQTFLYSRGASQLYAKHCRLGALPRVPRVRQMLRAARRVAALARIDQCFRRADRPSYLAKVASLAGSLDGFVRYHIFV